MGSPGIRERRNCCVQFCAHHQTPLGLDSATTRMGRSRSPMDEEEKGRERDRLV